ncbi:MAG: trypsin-like peptidase domain-containing protein [Clostridium sp.]
MTNKDNNFNNDDENISSSNNNITNSSDLNKESINNTTELNTEELTNTTILDNDILINSNSVAGESTKDSPKEPIKEFNDYKESVTNTVETNKKAKKEKHNSGMRGKLLSYILVGILCSSISAGIVSVLSMNVMNKKIDEIKTTNKNNAFSSTEFNTSGNLGLSVPDIAKKVGPSVVGISVKSVQSYGNSPFVQEVEGIGSGVIINEEGYILTNNHVVQNAKTINVILNNGKEVEAKVINTDPSYDLAIVKITEDIKMPGVAEFGDSENLSVGESVVAIGNPLGKELSGSVTTGVVSAINRNIDENNPDLKLIQTDAAISPGNSGGPLLNSNGQLIGINTQKRVGQGVEGLGFAIPIHQIQPKIENLMKPKIMLGITIRPITEEDSKRYELPIGLFINDIAPFSSAEKAGIKIGDIILAFNGEKVKTNDELTVLKEKCKDGDQIPVEIDRNGEKLKLTLTLETGY